MTTGDTIKIELSNQEAEMFRTYMQFHDNLVAVIKSGALTVKNGKAILNFNHEGKICDVELSYHTFKIGK